MILTRTPLRVSLFGGGSDYVEHSAKHGGAVLGMAVNKYVYVGVKHMPPGQLMEGDIPIKYRVQYSKVDDCARIEDVRHPAVKAALKYFGVDTPLEFHVFGDLPGRSGLGGSSAFSVGLLHALTRLLKLPSHFDPLGWAAEAVAFEQHMIGEAVGVQDQIFAAVGGINFIEFGEAASVNRVNLSPERTKELEEALILVYSGSMRDAHKMASAQIAKAEDNEARLKLMTDQAYIARDELQSDVPLDTLGLRLDSMWKLKRELCPGMTSPEIDALYEDGKAAGALGGKLLGAGGGGFMLFYVPKDKQESFVTALTRHTPLSHMVRFKVAAEGTKVVIDEEE